MPLTGTGVSFFWGPSFLFDNDCTQGSISDTQDGSFRFAITGESAMIRQKAVRERRGGWNDNNIQRRYLRVLSLCGRAHAETLLLFVAMYKFNL